MHQLSRPTQFGPSTSETIDRPLTAWLGGLMTDASQEANGPAFGPWLVGPADEPALTTVDGRYARGLIRNRIRHLGRMITDSDHLVAIVGIGDDKTLCASVAVQLHGAVATVLDPRSPGWVTEVLDSQPVTLAFVSGETRPVPGIRFIDLDAETASADREYHAGRVVDDPGGFPARTGDCLVLFTSGSSGTPKGVLRTHESIPRSWLAAEAAALRLPDNHVTVAGPVGYVSSQLLIHQAFRTGLPLSLYDIQSSGLAGLAEFMARNSTTLFNTQVATYRTMLESVGFDRVPLRLVTVWGEPMSHADVDRHRYVQPRCDLIIGYGSSETMIGGIVEMPAGSPPPEKLDEFQTPAHVAVLIVEPNDAPTAKTIGSNDHESSGELLVSNPWVASGYFGLPEASAQTFIEINRRRWCRTGDRARWTANDRYVLLGRIDDRLKVLGNNVEPLAVEAVLRERSDIRDVSIVAADRPRGGLRLVAFVVPYTDVNIAELRLAVAQRLPAASVPTVWSVVAVLPRLQTGKVDRSALQRQASTITVDTHPDMAPTNRDEQVAFDHVRVVLGLNELGIDDNLADLGMDSLMMVELQGRIATDLKAPPSLTAMATNPTVRSFAGGRRSGRKRSNGPLVRFGVDDEPHPPKDAVETVTGGIRFVLIPGAAANVLYLRPLAQLLARHGEVRAVATTEMSTIPDIVTTTLAALRNDSTEELILVGHSFGGLIALEMARIASDYGLRIASVVLLDTSVPSPRWSILRARAAFRPRARLAELRKRTRRFGPVPPIANRASLIAMGDDLFLSRHFEVNAFRWRPAPTRAVAIVAGPESTVRADLWEEYFLGGVDEIRVQGGHSSILKPPYVQRVGEVIVDVHHSTSTSGSGGSA